VILLLPGNAKSLLETLGTDPDHYGWLLTPRRTFTKQRTHGLRFGVDNDCYSQGNSWNPITFLNFLLRIRAAHDPHKCLFANAPDVPCNAAATLQKFACWGHIIRALGLPVALVGQDGLENLTTPWQDLDALFIGGSTQWKLGPAAANLITEAKALGKWTHIGRVNSVARASRLRTLPDSVDGTAWAHHPAKYATQWRNWVQAGLPRFTATLEI